MAGTRVITLLLAVVAFSTLISGARANPDFEITLPVSKSEALQLDVPVNVENGAKIFAGCVGCHDTGPSAVNRVGPMLNGIVGRSAASIADYAYSKALARAGKDGLVWTPYKLDAFLMAPGTFLQGNKMAFVGVADDSARRDLIGYLKTLE